MKDFESRKNYFGTIEKYYLWDVTELHEKAHKDRFLNLLNGILNEKVKVKGQVDDDGNPMVITYAEWLTVYRLLCVNYSSPAKVKNFWEKKLNRIIDEILDKLEFAYKNQKGNLRKNEIDTQKTDYVQERIREYIKYLKVKYPNIKCN